MEFTPLELIFVASWKQLSDLKLDWKSEVGFGFFIENMGVLKDEFLCGVNSF